ncbi:hypothetical protein ABT160_16510 [Streptomyces sp. NPDC001941]|uniref:hypothetical protein n=1 Tax=Streptomyces sp. NPDC001941 TaxID=3154659 RepID=UPI00331FB074
MGVRGRGAWGSGAAAVALLAAGCAAGGPAFDEDGFDRPRPTVVASSAGQDQEESLDVAPRIPEGETVLAIENVQGGRELEFLGGVREGALGFAVSCRGTGTVTVSYDPAGLSFPLTCEQARTNSVYNRFETVRARKEASVRVDAPSTLRWSMSVGQ